MFLKLPYSGPLVVQNPKYHRLATSKTFHALPTSVKTDPHMDSPAGKKAVKASTKPLEFWIDAACSIRDAKDAVKYENYVLSLSFTAYGPGGLFVKCECAMEETGSSFLSRSARCVQAFA